MCVCKAYSYSFAAHEKHCRGTEEPFLHCRKGVVVVWQSLFCGAEKALPDCETGFMRGRQSVEKQSVMCKWLSNRVLAYVLKTPEFATNRIVVSHGGILVKLTLVG